MLLYTSILVVCFLVAVPIMILIYESIFVASKAASDSGCDELIATTVRISGPKYRVTPVNLDYAKATTRPNPEALRLFLEESLTSAKGSSKVGAKAVPGAVTFESVCKPFKRKVPADTQNSETVKKPFSKSSAPMTPNPGTVSHPFSKSLAPMTPNPGTVSKPFSRSLAPMTPNSGNASRPWGW